VKTLLITAAVALTLAAPTAQAQATDDEGFCETLYEYAESVMIFRQDGQSMPGMVATTRGDEMLTAIIQAAFNYPRMNMPENQRELVRDFANDTYLQCLQENSK